MAKVVYPDFPKTKNGYTDEWISAFLSDKLSKNEIKKKQVVEYRNAIKDKESIKDRRTIFYDMFIDKTPPFLKALDKIIEETKPPRAAKKEEE